MLLIEAIVMVSQEYGDHWQIQGQYGRISKIGKPPVYMALDSADRDFIKIGALEHVLAALIERNPPATTDAHWKISPFQEAQS